MVKVSDEGPWSAIDRNTADEAKQGIGQENQKFLGGMKKGCFPFGKQEWEKKEKEVLNREREKWYDEKDEFDMRSIPASVYEDDRKRVRRNGGDPRFKREWEIWLKASGGTGGGVGEAEEKLQERRGQKRRMQRAIEDVDASRSREKSREPNDQSGELEETEGKRGYSL